MAKWRGLNLDEMWLALRGENLGGLETQIKGWKALSELFKEQHDRLETYETAVKENWTSPGGDAYLAKLTEVKTSLYDSYLLFMENAYTLENVRAQIAGAKGALKSLIDSFNDGPMDDAWNEFRAAEHDKTHSDGPLGVEGITDWSIWGGDPPKRPDREEVLEKSGYNDRGGAIMDSLVEKLNEAKSNFKEPPKYKGPTNAKKPQSMGMPMPATPSAPGAPGAPGTPAAPPAPPVPTAPTFNAQLVPGAPAKPTAPTPPPTPNAPPTPTAPGAPATPGAPPPVAAPTAPGAPGSARVPASPLRPTGASRPVAPTKPSAPGAPAAPGKPGAPGRMAPPPSGMSPKNNNKRGIGPKGGNRPGTPTEPGAPGKPGRGRMAPPPSGMSPKSGNRKGTQPGRPVTPGAPGAPGRPGKGSDKAVPPPGVGGKPAARKSGKKPGTPTHGGTPSSHGGGQFTPPPHIAPPRTNNKPKQRSSYGKFLPPEAQLPSGGVGRVTRPGGARPVLGNKSVSRMGSAPSPRGMGVPQSLTPPRKAPRAKTDEARGVIRPSERDPSRQESPLTEQDRTENPLLDPLTAHYMEEFAKIAGLKKQEQIATPAPEKKHVAGPIIGY